MLRRATALKRICDRQRVQNALTFLLLKYNDHLHVFYLLIFP